MAKVTRIKKIVSSKKGLWELKHGITQSALTLWLACPHQFWLRYVQGWTPKEYSKPLAYGIMFHDCADKICKGGKLTNVVNDYNNKIKDVKELPYEIENRTLMIEVIRRLLRCYFIFWTKYDEKTTWRCREQTFDVPYDVGCFSPPIGAIIRLRGKWDGIPERNGKVLVMDTKTKSKIDEVIIRQSLIKDFQMMFYTFAAFLDFDSYPEGILLDVVRRPQLKQKTKESTEEFLARIEDDILDRPAWYFMRWEVPLLKSDVDNWRKQTLDPILNNFLQWYDSMPDLKSGGKDWSNPFASPLHYENTTALVSGWGPCTTFDIQTKGDYGRFHIRKDVFPELVD